MLKGQITTTNQPCIILSQKGKVRNKMYGFIGSSEYFKEVKEFVFSQENEFEYKIIGEDIDIFVELNNVSQVKVKYLIIDIAALVDEMRVVEAIQKFKLSQPKTQIIVIVSLKYIPGNAVISELVKLGVYDIIRHEIEQGSLEDLLLDHVIHPTPHRQAKKWEIEEETISEVRSSLVEYGYTNNEPIEDKYEKEFHTVENLTEECEEECEEEKKFFIQPKKVVERTITIIQEKIVGTAVIAFSGSTKRIGTTHISISMANFLSAKGFKVGVVEFHPSKHFESIRNAYDGIEEHSKCFKLNDTYFYPYQKELTVTDVLQEDFNYIILDMGEYRTSNMEEFHRANKKVIISGVKEWEIPSLEKILLNEKNIYINKYLYAFNFADDNTFQFVKGNMGQMSCFKLEYNPNLFEVTEEAERVFTSILQDILPMENKKGSKKLFGFLKREG